VYRIDSIGLFEGAGNTWLMEAGFLGYEGRRVYGVLLHFELDGRTEIRPKMARVSDREVIRPTTARFSLPASPETVRQQIAGVLDSLGWGPAAISRGCSGLAAWPSPRAAR
jgi:hypothetical protein